MKLRRAAARAVLSAESVLGVDLGSHTLKVLRLRLRRRGGVAVLDYAEQELGDRLSKAKSEEERLAVYGEALRAIAREKGLTGMPCALSLSGNSILMRFFRLPRKHRLDPETGLPDDAKTHIAFDAREARFATRLLEGDSPDSPQAEMMLLAAEKRVAEAAAACARAGGLLPVLLVNDALALEAAHRLFGKPGPEVELLVDIGASTTSVLLVKDGAIRFARVLNVAGNSFTRAVRRELGVETEEAESLKRRFGLEAPAEDADAARVVKALRGPLRDLVVELRRTLHDHEDTPGAARVSRVLLSGGGARLRGLADSLAAELGHAVETFRPLGDASVAPGRDIAQASPSLAVAAGLAATGTLRFRGVKLMSLLPEGGAWAAATGTLAARRFELALMGALAAVLAGLYALTARWVAVRAERAEQALYAAPKHVIKSPPAPVKRAPKPPSPFAYLARLSVSGVVGGETGRAYMLTGGDRSFISRGGLLYDQDDALVTGVFVQAVDGKLLLTTSSREKFELPLPQ